MSLRRFTITLGMAPHLRNARIGDGPSLEHVAWHTPIPMGEPVPEIDDCTSWNDATKLRLGVMNGILASFLLAIMGVFLVSVGYSLIHPTQEKQYLARTQQAENAKAAFLLERVGAR